jgi:hypothetical protein
MPEWKEASATLSCQRYVVDSQVLYVVTQMSMRNNECAANAQLSPQLVTVAVDHN